MCSRYRHFCLFALLALICHHAIATKGMEIKMINKVQFNMLMLTRLPLSDQDDND
jgi:hypothetical protein